MSWRFATEKGALLIDVMSGKYGGEEGRMDPLDLAQINTGLIKTKIFFTGMAHSLAHGHGSTRGQPH